MATGGCGGNAGVAASYWLLAIGSCRLKVIGQRNCNENEDDDENGLVRRLTNYFLCFFLEIMIYSVVCLCDNYLYMSPFLRIFAVNLHL